MEPAPDRVELLGDARVRLRGGQDPERHERLQLRPGDVPLLLAAFQGAALNDHHALAAVLQRRREEDPERPPAHGDVVVARGRGELLVGFGDEEWRGTSLGAGLHVAYRAPRRVRALERGQRGPAAGAARLLALRALDARQQASRALTYLGDSLLGSHGRASDRGASPSDSASASAPSSRGGAVRDAARRRRRDRRGCRVHVSRVLRARSL